MSAPIADIATRRTSLGIHPVAALGYATIATAEIRDGRIPQARAALRDAIVLCSSLHAAPASLAVRVHLSVARAALGLADLQEAHFALDQAQEMLCQTADAAALRCELHELRGIATQLSTHAPIGLSLLTPAEFRVLHLLPSHLTFEEIGESLHVSRNTVKTQALSVYRKLNVSSRSEAVRSARRLGLVAA
jgi:LuxR family maltose regulon positive regulatory protein